MRLSGAIGCLSLLLILLTGYLYAEDFEKPAYGSWLMPSPQLQIYIEGLDDRKGLGRIFVPAMTRATSEPLYAVFQNDELIGEQNAGSSFFVKPGKYTVVYGSGTLDQRIRKDVEITTEETIIIQPTWGALTIEVIDEVRNYFKQDLQVFLVETGESYGVIPSINPELGEHLQTLILKPGLYKIVKRGDDLNTYVNFATVLLEPGMYTPFTIVIDNLTSKFVGAGILATSSQLKQRKHWSIFGAAHVNVILNAANNASSSELQTNLTTLGQLDNRLIYDNFPHYYLSNNLLELGAQRQEGAKFQLTQDRLSLKNTYVYYILKWLGGYGRFEVTTHFFDVNEFFSSARNIRILDPSSGAITQKNNANRIKLEPAFFPLSLKEGVGANLAPLKTFFAKVNVRAGLGYWQTLNNNVYRKDTFDDSLYLSLESQYTQGLETSLTSYFAVLGNLSINTDLDILFPFSGNTKTVLELENFISFQVSRNVTMEHTLRLKKDPMVNHLLQEQFVSLRISYYIF